MALGVFVGFIASGVGDSFCSAQTSNSKNSAPQAIVEQTNLGLPTEVDGPREVPSLEEIEPWIKKLGSKKYSERLQATDVLGNVDGEGLKRLQEVAKTTTDVELQVRLRSIISKVSDVEYHTRVKAFLRDLDSNDDHGFKSWPLFRKIVGNGRLARKQFIEMYDLHPELIDAVVVSSDQDRERIKVLAESAIDAMKLKNNSLLPLEIGDGLSLLFIGAVSDVGLGPNIEHFAGRCLQRSPLNSVLLGKKESKTLRPLLSKWFENLEHDMEPATLNIAVRLEIEQAVPYAKKLLTRPIGSVDDARLFSLAARYLAKYGRHEDLPILEAWLENESVCGHYNFVEAVGTSDDVLPRQRLIVCRIQDIALAACVEIAKLDFQQFNPRVRRDSFNMLIESSLGYPIEDVEQRALALKKWKELRPN